MSSQFAREHVVYSIDEELVSGGRGLFCFFSHQTSGAATLTPAPALPPTIHPPQLYEPFYADFGPLNLGKTYRFCARTAELLEVRES